MSGTISATTAALIAAAVGAVGTGAGLYEAHESSEQNQANQAAQKAELLQQQQAQAAQANLSKQEAVLGAEGQTQAQTGGSLTDSGTASLTDLLAGYPGYQGGSSTTGTPGTSPGGTNTSLSPNTNGGASNPIAAILAALRNGTSGGSFGNPGPNISGGNWPNQSEQPQAWQQLSNPVL